MGLSIILYNIYIYSDCSTHTIHAETEWEFRTLPKYTNIGDFLTQTSSYYMIHMLHNMFFVIPPGMEHSTWDGAFHLGWSSPLACFNRAERKSFELEKWQTNTI